MELTIDRKGFIIGVIFMLVAMGILYFCTTQVYKDSNNQDVASNLTPVQQP